MRIDLNADVGEAATAQGLASELAVHAGDADTMRRTIDAAASRALAIGAHPGYADRDGFGRRELTLPPAAVTALVLDQIQLLASIASASGVRLVHVKPHGALYNQAVRDRALASAIAPGASLAGLTVAILAPRCRRGRMNDEG